MTNSHAHRINELTQIKAENRPLFMAVAIFSFFANLLLMTGPLFMLLVYNSVLASGSAPTLVALCLLVLFLFIVMAMLDYARGRIMARIGAGFQTRLDLPVFQATLQSLRMAPGSKPQSGLQDLQAVQRLFTSPGLIALYDIPWVPIFMIGIWIFHPLLGLIALGGGVLLITLTILTQIFSKSAAVAANSTSRDAEDLSDQIIAEVETVQAMGMQNALFHRWQELRNRALNENMQAADVAGSFASISKSMRLLLQSGMLAAGAWLVMQNQVSAGVMIASSILLGRALSPIESALAHWPTIQSGFHAWRNLRLLMADHVAQVKPTSLPDPKGRLEINQATVFAPGKNHAALRMISFDLEPGQACGVIGPSGAGKSTLARLITGNWQPAGGQVRLSGAPLSHYDPSELGKSIGYLPQQVQLFPGTIAQNIARMSNSAETATVHRAAQIAGAYDIISDMADGFDTQVGPKTGQLSGGQLQRIGLARAMYGDPALIVLDEPNSNLDNAGNDALNAAIRAIKKDGRTVIIMAHRPSAIKECDMLLMIENGARKAFGAKEEVLRKVVQNHAIINAVGPEMGVA